MYKIVRIAGDPIEGRYLPVAKNKNTSLGSDKETYDNNFLSDTMKLGSFELVNWEENESDKAPWKIGDFHLSVSPGLMDRGGASFLVSKKAKSLLQNHINGTGMIYSATVEGYKEGEFFVWHFLKDSLWEHLDFHKSSFTEWRDIRGGKMVGPSDLRFQDKEELASFKKPGYRIGPREIFLKNNSPSILYAHKILVPYLFFVHESIIDQLSTLLGCCEVNGLDFPITKE